MISQKRAINTRDQRTAPTGEERRLLFEILIETIFTSPLDAVPKERWCPSTKQVTYSPLRQGDFEACPYAAILFAVNLHVALYNVEWRNTRVRGSCVRCRNVKTYLAEIMHMLKCGADVKGSAVEGIYRMPGFHQSYKLESILNCTEGFSVVCPRLAQPA